MTSKNEIATGFIEPDDVAESGYETAGSAGAKSETTSIASSLQEWLMENGKLSPSLTTAICMQDGLTPVGRRYHAYYGPDKNLMPTDEVLVPAERTEVTTDFVLDRTRAPRHPS